MSTRNGKIILIGIVIGAILGGLSGSIWIDAMKDVKWIGDFFKDSLKMLIVPVVVFSMISGISSLGNVKKLGGIGTKTLLYYFITTGIAVVIGIIVVNIIQPGVGVDNSGAKLLAKVTSVKDKSFLDIISGLVHPNILSAMSMKSPKMMPTIIFSIMVGIAIASMGKKAKVAKRFFSVMNDVTMKLVSWIFWLAPVGIFGLIASQVAHAGGSKGLAALVSKVGAYFGTVVAGLTIHGLIVLPLIYYLVTRKNPLIFFRNMADALGTAFSTASSSATLPLTMECAVDFNKIPKKSASFVLPLGATINMDGTALYEAVAAITIAQVYGIDLSIGQQIIIFITANLAAIGAAGIPQAGFVTMVLVLQSVGLPLEGMSLILGVDWLLDRFRTTVNVWGDSIGAAVIATTKEIRKA